MVLRQNGQSRRGSRPEETWARAVIELELDSPVSLHDDGSEPGMFDLVIHNDGGFDAVEVVAAADAACIELWKLVNDRDDRWVDSRLTGGWAVELAPTARAGNLLAALPDLLLQIEEASDRRAIARPVEVLYQRVRDLGVTRLSQSDTDFPGSIYLMVDQHQVNGMAGIDAARGIATWVSDFLAAPEQADVVSKLAKSGAIRTHAFIVVPVFSTAPMSVVGALLHSDPPSSIGPPELPASITDVWMASTWAIGMGLRWSAEMDWKRFSTAVGE